MALAKIIFKLDSADLPVKEQHYANISKLLLENAEEVYDGINNETIKNLSCNILDDLKKEKENPQLVKLLQSLLQNKIVLKFFPKTDQEEIFRNVVSTIDSSQHENVLVNYFSVLIQMPSFPNIEEAVLNDLLLRIEDVLSNKRDPASIYSACNYFQKFLKDYEEKLSSFISVLSKIVFIPLCHPSNKVREVAEKSLDMFPKILLYSSDEISTSSLLKLLKESYCKEMLQLFKEKQEIYVLKVWTHVVKALGNALSANLSNITPFFQVIEKGFKSNVDEIIIESFVAWRSLIDSFSGTEGALNDSKRLRFLLKPFKNISRFSENVLSVACDTWMHLAWNLAEHLSGRFSEVCIPLLELTVGKLSNGLSEKISQKGGSDILVKKSCFLLLRFLELPSNDSFNRLSSPKKLPRIPYPSLQTPLDIKIITHHFKEILCVVKIIIEAFGTREDMKSYLDCLMKSVLFIVSTVIEDSNKESAEAVNQFINFLSEIIDAKVYPSQACLKCLESLSKMSRKVLVSHSFNCGSRKPQDILCNSLLKMLLNPHLFPSEFPKRFFAAYNRLIQAGIHESFHPLSNAHKFMHVIRNAVGTSTVDGDVLIELWSGIAGTLLEVIEKTQEVNQGDKQEHDFSCMYNVLLFPFEFIFPVHIQQFRTRPVTKLWTSLYKAFICSANLVSTTSVNEACENFCMKLKSCLKEDVLKKPHFIESFCLFLQSIMETIDFVSGSTSGAQGMIEVALMMKRKKPLGNLTSFVDLLVILLKAYQTHYVEAEEDSMQSSAPAIQRKVHIVKNAAPLDILKAFFGEIKSGSIISLSLEQLVDCVAKLFLKSSQKRNLMSHSDAKLEMLWNVITSTVERYYLGPYDSDFLTLMSPLLEATFSHPRRNIKEKSRRFWFATFAPNASSLKFPDSLKNLLKKMKLPLLPDDINPTDFSISPMPDSLLGDSSEIHPSSVPLVLTKPFKSPVSVNGEVSKVAPKEIKQSPKISIDDLPSEEFVKIDTPVVITPRQRNVRKKRSYVPALYNDLSQDTATLLSSSESQDTANSATFEDVPKEPVVETSPKASSGKELFSTGSTSHEDETSVSKNAKSPTVSKFVEKLDECLKDQVINAEEFPASLEINNETKISTKFATESTHSALGEKSAKHSEITSDKISVFSKPGDKCLTPRNTRRNSKLSQSFSVSLSEKKSEKLELQKLNKSCIELITLGDSDDIIPSSQGSGESESGVKLSANTSHQKSQPTDDSDLKACENPSKDCLSLEDMKDDDVDDDDMTKNVNFVTSTPLKKSSLPSLSVVSKACAISEENSTSKPDVLSTSNVSDVKIDLAEESNNKVVEDKHQEIVPEGLNQSMEVDIQTNSKETIKDISILLDAVNNLVNTTSEKCNPEPISETSDSITSDVEMKNVSESEIKTGDPSSCGMEEKIHSLNKSDEMKHDNSLPQSSSEPDIKKGSASEFEIKKSVVSTAQEEIPSPYEPVAKRSRLSLKLLEKNSQNEDYSQKLRKKSANTESKPQQKPKKRKFVKKDEISNKKVKNTSKDKKDFAPSMDCENVESDQISNIDENKVMNKDEQNCLESENFKDFENSELQTKCSNFINEENIEVAGQSLDKKEIDNESTSQNTVNTESCEIFEVHSSNSVDIQNSDLAVVPEGSQSSHSSSQSDNDKSDDMDSQESQLSPKQNEPFHTSTNNVYNADSKNVHLNDDDEIKANNISVIPCSLESFIDSCSSNKMEVANSDVQIPDSLSEPVKSKTDPEAENIDSSVRFSAIEDDLSCEMRRIVDSVVDVNCERNGTVNLHENQSVSVQEENVLNSSDPVVNSGKESITCDNKSDSSISEEKEHSTELLSNKIMPNLLPSDSKEKVNYIEEYDSCDVIMSSSSENDSESSVQILADSTATDTQEVNQNVLNSCEANMAETNPDDSAEKSISQSNNNFSPELDHSYSSKPSEGDELPASKLEEPASKLEEDSSSSEEIDVVTVDPIHAYNASFENLNMDGHEISCLMRDLVIKIEKINIANFCSSVDRNHEGIFKTDIRNTSSNLNHAANKENEDNLAKGSKRRKIKPPIRSPFNFRQRAKIESTKKLPAKNIKAINVTQVKSLSENKDLVIKSLFSKDDLEEEADNSMAKIISSIVDSITVEDDAKTDMLPNIPSSSQMSKAQRLELSTDELTDLNTRLNAQIAHQTRRMKVIADSQTSTENSNDPSHSNTVPENSEESSSTNLSSILKKRKSSGEVSPKKVRKVTFASPLIHELVFDSCAESRTIDAVTMNRIQNLNKKRKKNLQEKNKTGKLNSIRATVANESEDSPSSSSEYQDSDILDFNDLPVSPALINCPDDIAYIIRHLTSPSWVRGLESLLASKNIKTIGDLCKLNIHQVKALPFKSPKVMTLHKALVEYIDATQENTLQNFKKIDNGSFVEMNDSVASHSTEDCKSEKKEENLEDNAVLLEETIRDILKKDSLKELPLNLLGQLVEACGKAIIEKNQSS